MKRFASLLAIFMAFSFAFNPSMAEAKKFGGGKSFGKSFKTAPKQPAAAPLAGKQQAAKPGSNKKGMLGGLMGGLLAGGLIAALLSGGFDGFDGLQMMDMLMMAGLAFVLFKVFKSMAQKRAMAAAHGPMAGHGQQQNPMQQAFSQQNDAVQQRQNMGFDAVQSPAQPAGFGASDVPMNLPAGFDMNGFMNGARDHYRTLQEAWNTGDLEKMREYVAPELFAELKAERATLSGEQHTEVMFVDAEMGRADHNAQLAEISVRFTGKYRDTVEGVEEDIKDIWHLQRDLTQANAPWLIVGIEEA
ncbi:preprotein translocase subunit Tim44 [Endozoicomonas sp. OPT23]|nr:preprotein translocase subunit Tim44 [Endozoicomonas sp. OPT23]